MLENPLGRLAALVGEIRLDRGGLGRGLVIARSQKQCLGLRKDVAALGVREVARPPEAQQEPRPLGIVLGPEVDGLLVVALRGRERR